MTSSLQYLTWSADGPVATITFNRPAKRNGLTVDVLAELEDLVHRARDDRSIRVAILAGTGPAFCAGADLRPLEAATTDEERAVEQERLDRIPRVIGRIFDAMVHADLVSIAAVNGFAVGGGWSIALACDHQIAVEGAQFWLPEVEIGMAFKGLPNVALTRRLGPALAREALILGRRFSAEELLAHGVLNQVCPLDELATEARAAADRYLALPWRSVLATRRDINTVTYGPQYY
ncbi:MAG: enoyl-CoA hydratase/isomerase family protein [Actinomycetota bacterium]